jgi:hypothetical protein
MRKSKTFLVFSTSKPVRVTPKDSEIRGWVRVTLRLAVYRQSVRLGDKPLETDNTVILFSNWTLAVIAYVTSSLTRGLFCRLQLLLVLASAVILRSESCGTHDHIFYCLRFETPPTWRARVPVFISPRNRVARLYPQARGSSRSRDSIYVTFIYSVRTAQKALLSQRWLNRLFLRWDTVLFDGCFPPFRKKEAVCSSETSVNLYWTTRCHICSSTLTKIRRLKLLREIIAVYSEPDTKPSSAMAGSGQTTFWTGMKGQQ